MRKLALLVMFVFALSGLALETAPPPRKGPVEPEREVSALLEEGLDAGKKKKKKKDGGEEDEEEYRVLSIA